MPINIQRSPLGEHTIRVVPTAGVRLVSEGPQGKPGVQGVPGPQGAPGDLTRPVADATYERKLIDTAVWRVDAGALSADGLSLLDLSGNDRPAVFGAGAAKPVVLPYDGEPYLHIPATAGNGATITTSAALPYTATRRDGTTVTGTTPAGAWTFTTAGDWARIATDNGAHILDPRNVSADYTKIRNTGTAGGDWTIKRAETGFKTAVVDRPLLLFGGGQTAISSNYRPDINGPMTVLLAARDHYASGTVVFIMASAGYTSPGWAMYRNPTYVLRANTDSAGSLLSTEYSTGAVPLVGVVAGVRGEAGLKVYRNGTPGAATPLTSTVTPGADLQILPGTSAEFIAAAIFDRALTDAEVAQASAELLGTPHYAQTDPHVGYPPLVAGTTPAALPVGAREGTIAVLADNRIAVRTRTGGWKVLTATDLTGAPPA